LASFSSPQSKRANYSAMIRSGWWRSGNVENRRRIELQLLWKGVSLISADD
jgi:hypothetical protein